MISDVAGIEEAIVTSSMAAQPENEIQAAKFGSAGYDHYLKHSDYHKKTRDHSYHRREPGYSRPSHMGIGHGQVSPYHDNIGGKAPARC